MACTYVFYIGIFSVWVYKSRNYFYFETQPSKQEVTLIIDKTKRKKKIIENCKNKP